MASSPALSQTLLVTYTPRMAPRCSTGDLEAGGVASHLEAAYLPEGAPAIGLAEPLRVTIQYNEAVLAPHVSEANLEVGRYSGDLREWVPLQVVSRDLVHDRIAVLLDHFSEFMRLGPVVNRSHLPVAKWAHWTSLCVRSVGSVANFIEIDSVAFLSSADWSAGVRVKAECNNRRDRPAQGVGSCVLTDLGICRIMLWTDRPAIIASLHDALAPIRCAAPDLIGLCGTQRTRD